MAKKVQCTQRKVRGLMLNGSGTCNMDVTKRKCQIFPLKADMQ